ncbi:MAG: adenylate kinase [Candidatus Nomurabacteria bacterium GW2011_GWB1_44_12]|uniref:Adenylate kinase n=1 Tax=Candidatus Nomurabacteria bacterium GW2011_GWB1_44_12 TaxID=1618748 RepID=A0A837II35_9BACT|nr:MAG: adenylate kinase [Candidatus Nomurabacteria bacterium GW2011_GWB1_44_12]
MNLQTVIFTGRSGAGKGMQSQHLEKYLAEHTPDTPVLHIETGEYVWDRARKIIDLGNRQPDFLAIWMWTTAFIQNFKGNEHLVFDGAPRALPEALILDTALPFFDRVNPAVVYLKVSQEWAEERLKGRGRADDLKPEVVARRFAFFEKDVVPVIEHYRNNPAYRFLEINGEQTPEQVFDDVRKGLGI